MSTHPESKHVTNSGKHVFKVSKHISDSVVAVSVSVPVGLAPEAVDPPPLQAQI